MTEELFKLFKLNLPFIVKNDDKAKEILNNKDNKIIEERINNELIGVSVINKNTILLLCVNKEYRNKDIGSKLLEKSEKLIKENGYDEIVLGVGFDYLMPGVPTSKRYYEYEHENLYKKINEDASNFFAKHGYVHSWDCNCFDMRFELENFDGYKYSIGDTIDGIYYRWATVNDIDSICICTDDAEESFTKYYKNTKLYKTDNDQRVLIALKDNEVVGTLIVSNENEGKGIGSIGCTSVKHSYRGKHIAVNMTILATKYLKELGLKEGFLGYTYTGLDHLYGYAGYKICIYYMMGKKKLI